MDSFFCPYGVKIAFSEKESDTMQDVVMLLSSVFFGILFTFLVFIFAIFVISLFFKRKMEYFEPEISIVIPAYNEEKNIKPCLDLIFESNYPKNKLEVVVVDDGSTDNTSKTLKDYKNIKLIRQNHLGKVEALNLGIANSSHDFVVTIDADTSIDKFCLDELLKPFSDDNVGATTGNNYVKNNNSMITAFQNVEYHFNNLIRNSFSKVFGNSIWFFGSLACYRKSVLEKIGHFKKDTLAEDTDIALEIKKSGYKVVNVHTASANTVVPTNVKSLYKQRSRWWIGTLQSLVKNRSLFSKKSNPSILFLYINQYWWSFYAFLSLPFIIYQVNYWLPYNSQNLFSIFSYLFKWFSLMGPIYVIYKIPEWGISMYSIFGVLSGIITTIMIIFALRIFRDKNTFKNIFVVFFYFPYTIVLNTIILVSLLKHSVRKKDFFIK